MSIIQAIRDYIAACPLLHEGAIVGVDRLVAQGVAYTIDTTPCEPVVRQYVDGGSMRQFLFVFASREAYGTKVLENLRNSGFYEDFAEWIEHNDVQGILPDLGADRHPYKIEITSSGYAYDTGDDTARYQMQLRMLYYQARIGGQNG